MGKEIVATSNTDIQSVFNKLVQDDILYLDGEWTGDFKVPYRNGVEGHKITIRAAYPGSAVINGSKTGRDAFWIQQCSYLDVIGLEIKGGVRCGSYVSESSFVSLKNIHSHNNGVFGLLFGYCFDILTEYGEFNKNDGQHGIYFSQAGDRVVLQYNKCYDNGRCGIELNGTGGKGNGRIENAVIQYNEIYKNGDGRGDGGGTQGAAINLIAVDKSIIAYNRLYKNEAGGISLSSGCTDNIIDRNRVEFELAHGRQCLKTDPLCVNNGYKNNTFIMGKNTVPAVAGPGLVDMGGNIVSVATAQPTQV